MSTLPSMPKLPSGKPAMWRPQPYSKSSPRSMTPEVTQYKSPGVPGLCGKKLTGRPFSFFQ